jgi:signal transduction histidine kinase
MYRVLIFIYAFLYAQAGVSASPPLAMPSIQKVDNSKDIWNAEKTVYEFEDPDSNLSLESIDQKFKDGKFKVIPTNKIIFSKNYIWLRLEIENKQDKPKTWYLETPLAVYGEVDFYTLNKAGQFDHFRHGAFTLMSERQFPSRFPTIKSDFLPNEAKVFYIRMKSSNYLYPTFKVMDLERVNDYELLDWIINLIYIGLFMGLFFYNIFLAVTTRSKAAFFYCGFITSVFLTQAYFGDFFNLFPSNYDYRSVMRKFHTIYPFIRNIALYLSANYTIAALDSNKRTPRYYKVLQFFAHLTLFLSFISMTPIGIYFARITNFAIMSALWINAFACVFALRTGYKPAVLQMLSIICIGSGVLITQFVLFGVFPENVFTLNTVKFGNMMGMIFFSLALGQRYNFNILAELKLRILAEDKLRELNLDLAKQVEERTAQLLESNRRASLGEMAGGVAHEINSPLAVIHGYAKRIMKLAGRENSDPKDIIEKAESINQSVDKIFTLTRGLQTYSNNTGSDEITKEHVENIVKEAVEYCTNYLQASDIIFSSECEHENITLTCKRTLISNVLINMLENRIFSLKESQSKDLLLKVSKENQHVKFSVFDSGKIIDEDTKSFILNPFKEWSGIKKGSGLKLGLIKDALEKNKGNIKFGVNPDEPKFVLSFDDQEVG